MLPKKVLITEVSPRDGLQNEPVFVPTDIKIDFINRLSQTGLPAIEVTSFVSPQWVPALSDHDIVMKNIIQKNHVKYTALIPNQIGLENAIKADCKNIAVFTAISDTFSKKNTNSSIAESLKNIEEMIAYTKTLASPIFIRAYISCTLGCPYEGFITPEKTACLAKQLFEMGCDEIALGDTIGKATPNQACDLIHAVTQFIPIEKCAIHFHDTYGQALANIYACLQLGISKIDASVGGLGGCPYAKGASGNVATEEVVYLLHGLGIETGINLETLIQASRFIHAHLSHSTRSKVA